MVAETEPDPTRSRTHGVAEHWSGADGEGWSDNAIASHGQVQANAAAFAVAPWLGIIAALLIAEIANIAVLGSHPPGPTISNLVQLCLGALCVLACVHAARRSGNLGRAFWRLMTATFLVWVLAQSLGTYIEASSHSSLGPLSEILFVFSTCPLAMVLFLDPDNEPGRLDRIHISDFVQAILFWTAAYLYFGRDSGGTTMEFALWRRDLFLDAVIAGAFFLRVILTKSQAARTLFGRMLMFLVFSGMADAYANFPGRNLRAGAPFDLVWAALIAMPGIVAVCWRENKPRAAGHTTKQTRNVVAQQFFPILYPSLVLLLSPGVAARSPAWAGAIVLASFACFSGRLLVIQHRLQFSEGRLCEANAQLVLLSSVDGLTGVANRRMFDRRLEEESRRACRDGQPLALIMVDIDHFKKLNDSLGHQKGDDCLVRIARALNSRMRRAGDFVARFGGEEFVVLLPGMTARHAAELAEDLRRVIETMGLAHPDSDAGVVTASLGVAGAEGEPLIDYEELLKAADQALYAAKRAGRNRIACSSSGDVRRFTSREDEESPAATHHS